MSVFGDQSLNTLLLYSKPDDYETNVWGGLQYHPDMKFQTDTNICKKNLNGCMLCWARRSMFRLIYGQDRTPGSWSFWNLTTRITVMTSVTLAHRSGNMHECVAKYFIPFTLFGKRCLYTHNTCFIAHVFSSNNGNALKEFKTRKCFHSFTGTGVFDCKHYITVT